MTITKFKIKQFRNIKVKKIDSELGQKVQASGSKLEKIDDAVVDWHLPSLFKPQRLPDQLCGWEDELFNLFEVLSHSLFDRENNLCFNIVKFVIVFQCFRNMTNQQNL